MTTQIPQTPAATEILTGSEEKSSHVKSAPDQQSAASAEETEKETGVLETTSAPSAQQIPQIEEQAPDENPHRMIKFTTDETPIMVANPETVIVVVKTPQDDEHHNLQPKPHQPFSKRPKFLKEDFYDEHHFFTGENPYDRFCITHRKFWTRTQLNYYASVLCGKRKIFHHTYIPHCDMEEIPCFIPVLSGLHEAGLMPFCIDIGDWNTYIILYSMPHCISLVTPKTSTRGSSTG